MGDVVLLDHGSGGLMSRQLINEVIIATLGDAFSGALLDAAVLPGSGHIAMTTDSFTVDPLFFLGGDIGKLSVCGTVNDLAMSGAEPKYLSLAFVIEEGFELSALRRIVESVGEAARSAGVHIVAGDTKVMPRGAVHGIVINTAGVGLFKAEPPTFGSEGILPGDKVIVTNELGVHGLHILSLREGLGFEERVRSDCAPLNGLVRAGLARFPNEIRFLRDVTRGGLATVLDEIVGDTSVDVVLSRESLIISPEMEMGCSMLGVDPWHLANEGCLCAIVSAPAADALVDLWSSFEVGAKSHIAGEMIAGKGGVYLDTSGEDRVRLAPLHGRVLARLC